MNSQRRFVDLHTHSTASDGSLTPQQVVKLAYDAGLRALALTDHDTVDGLPAAAAAARDLGDEMLFIGGIEISAKFATGTLHILGLGLDSDAASLGPLLATLREARDQRNPRIVEKLSAMGMAITMDDVLEAAGVVGQAHNVGDQGANLKRRLLKGPANEGYSGSRRDEPPLSTQRLGLAPEQEPSGKRIIGRPHIAEALRRKGYVQTVAEAFQKYIARGGPAYVDKERLTPRQAIEAIHAAGGIAVLAHPVQLGCQNSAELQRIVRDFIHQGLDAIEAYHSQHSPQLTRQYLDLARRHKLIVTGGSDFHGPAKPDVTIGHPRVPVAAMGEEVLARLAKSKKR